MSLLSRICLTLVLLQSLWMCTGSPPLAAERVAQPTVSAASALRSVLSEAARPASAAASALRDAVKAAPTPAALAASAAKAVVEPLLPARGASTAPTTAPRATAPTLPAAEAPAAAPAPVPPGACLRTSDLVAACQPSQRLALTPIVLPTAHLGQAYKPRLLVTGGMPPFRVDLVDGSKPEGLEFGSDGSLVGTPIGAVRAYRFTVQITDTSSPALTVRQAYTMRVEPPPAPRPARPATAVSATPAAPVAAPAPPPPAQHPPQIVSYMLLQEDLDDMFPKVKPAVAASAASAAPATATAAATVALVAPPAPAASEPRRRVRPRPNPVDTKYADKMQAMLGPMLSIDYPTAELFASALEARRCAHYANLISDATKTLVTTTDFKCPTDTGGPPDHPGAASLDPKLFAELLPSTVKNDLIAQAEWPHPFADAKPVKWTDNGCGCTQPLSPELTYGLFPFWQARADEAKQQVDFSQFSRIGYVGMYVSDSGEVIKATPFDEDGAEFIRTARRFGTSVDAVVHRSDWARLLRMPDGEVNMDRAVRDTLALADTPMPGAASRVRRFFLPFWDEPATLFDGITLFFDYAPTDPAERERFRAYYRSFVHKLVASMQKTGRRYMLNIVVPDTELGRDGAYSFEQLMGYIRLAQMPTNPRLPEGAEEADYIGTTDITVSLLVWLHEPTSPAKKEVRARIDNTEVIQGHRRVTFLNALVPVIMHSGAEPKALPESVNEDRLNLDFAYFKWQYGGVGFWPLPRADTTNGKVINKVMRTNFGKASTTGMSTVCNWVCPNRGAIRLLFTALLLIGVVSLSLYFWSCTVRRLGLPYLVFLWLGGVVVLVVGMSLLTCDPQLENLRRGNALLVGLLVITMVTGMYFSLRPREQPP